MINRRVLVISNNCFSQSDSNGRTLGNMFFGWPKDNIAQFCVIAKDPNWGLCNNYYCLEDKTVLSAFLKLKKANGRILLRQKTGNTDVCVETVRPKTGSRTAFKLLLRRLAWSFKRWNSHSFTKWVDDFNPDMVLLQLGDSSFMFDIALHIATNRNVPLVTFCTEGYYFFERNCFVRSKWDFLFYPIYKKLYNHTIEKTMPYMKYAIYCNSLLQKDYTDKFGIPSDVIYTGSTIKFFPKGLDKNNLRISYLGNLGIDRDSALIEVGEVLHSINPKYAIDVYGKADEAMQKRFFNAPGVTYHGLVSYDEVKRIIEQSDILFHVESERGYIERQLQYAFSTKIADSISSGKCFVLFAPRNLACSKYIIENECGWFASTKVELKTVLIRILNDKTERDSVLCKAKQVAQRNHDYDENARKFQEKLLSV